MPRSKTGVQVDGGVTTEQMSGIRYDSALQEQKALHVLHQTHVL